MLSGLRADTPKYPVYDVTSMKNPVYCSKTDNVYGTDTNYGPNLGFWPVL